MLYFKPDGIGKVTHQLKPPALDLAFPRCLLAGTKACPMTLSLAIEDSQHFAHEENGAISIFARSNGRFLGFDDDHCFNKSKACATVEVPGPDVCIRSDLAVMDVFFTLDVPVSPGLVSLEFEFGGSPLSNRKPVSLALSAIHSCSLVSALCRRCLSRGHIILVLCRFWL